MIYWNKSKQNHSIPKFMGLAEVLREKFIAIKKEASFQVTWALILTAVCGCQGFYAFSHAAFSDWNMLSSFCVLENPIHFSSFNLNVSSCVKPSFILSNPVRSDYTLWSSSPMLTWLLLQVLPHWVTIVYFHIHPLTSPLTYHLL